MKIVDDTFPREKLQVMTGEQARSIYNPQTEYDVSAPKEGISATARLSSLRAIQNIPEGMEIMWGQSKMVVGDMLGNESLIKSGQSNIQSANRNLEMIRQEQSKTALNLTDEEQNSMRFLLNAAGTQYSTQLALALIPGVGTASSLAYMGGLMSSGTAIEGVEQYKEENPDDVYFEGFKDVAGKELGLNLVKTGTGLVVEKLWGVTGQLKSIKSLGAATSKQPFKAGFKQTMKQVGKGFTKGYAQEFATEMSQSVTDAGFDYLLGRYKDGDEVAEAIMGNVKGAVAAAVFGGGAGGSGALYYRSQAIQSVKEELKGTVPEQDLNNVATNIVDRGITDLKGAMDVEIELSSQLKGQHGDVFNSMVKAVTQTMDNSGAFTDMTESQRAEYATETAKMFADQTLAEAHKRKSLISDVIKSSDIQFKDGKLLLADIAPENKKAKRLNSRMRKVKSQPKRLSQFIRSVGGVKDEGGTLKAMDAGKQFIGLINNKKGMSLDDMGVVLMEEGFFIERPSINEILDAIAEDMSGNKIYSMKDQSEVIEGRIKETEDNSEDILNEYISDYAAQRGEDISVMSYDDKIQLYNEIRAFSIQENYEDSLLEPRELEYYMDLDLEFLDSEQFLEAYGVTKQEFSEKLYPSEIYFQQEVYDEQGKADITTPEFKNWFGDSKVVDENGQPLVVYHGTNAEFDAFELDLASKGGLKAQLGLGFYFVSGERAAKLYGKKVMPTYLSIEKIREVKMREITISKDETKKILIDGNSDWFFSEWIPFSLKDRDGYLESKNIKDYSREELVDEYSDYLLKSSDGDVDILKELGKAYKTGSNKLLSESMAKNLNADGFVFNDTSGEKVYTAFSPNQIKSVYNKGTFSEDSDNIYLQKKDTIKGQFDVSEKAITITKNADTSTLPHELAHYWLDNMLTYDASGVASPEYKAQLQIIKDFIGWREGMTRSQKTKAHEKFARGYEKYILTGNLPTSMMGNTFDEYDKWLKSVYNKANRLNVKLSDDAVRFFDSMTTGELITAETNKAIKEQAEKEVATREVEEVVKESENYIEAREDMLEEQRLSLPVTTPEYGTSYLKSVQKTAGLDIEAGTVNLQDQLQKAEQFVKDNPERAQKIVQGLAKEPEGVLKNSIYIAYDKLQKQLGNTDARTQALINQGLELRRAGQEISSQRLAYENGAINSPQYWISEVLSNRIEIIANKNKMTVKELNAKIKDKVKEITDSLPQENADVYIEQKIKELSDELGVLYQKDVDFKLKKSYDTKVSAYNEIYRMTNARLKTGLSQQEATEISRIADDMLADINNSVDKTGNPTISYFEKLAKMENYTNGLAPSSTLRILTSVIMRGNLLASIKSPFLNIQSNALFGGLKALSRRIQKQSTQNDVDPQAVKEYKDYSYDLFKRTGYNISTMTADNIGMSSTLGEKITHSEGEGIIRKVGRIYQDTIYKWGLGWGDVLAKDFTFVDNATLEATLRAKEAGMSATELFKDAIRLEPQTKIGKEIRQQSIEEALIATYQDDSAISKGSLKVRSGVDAVLGEKGLAEALLPFVKTPANVIAQGIRSGFGIPEAMARQVINSWKQKTLLAEPDKATIKALVDGGMGVAFAMLLSSLFDEDDYMPPYALASSKDKQLAKQLNIPFNSVKAFGVWINLDYLSVLGVPIAGVLNAKREEGSINKIYSYFKSGLIQASNVPFLGGISDIAETIETGLRKKGEDVALDSLDGMVEFVFNRSIPALVSDIAKVFDAEERERTIVATQVPIWRNEQAGKYSYVSGEIINRGENTVARVLRDLLMGARVKVEVENAIGDEFKRLNDVGQGVSLSTVTKYGDLKSLPDDKKEMVEREFAREYSKQVNRLIRTMNYRRKSDEDKKLSINKIRNKVRDQLKNKYLKKKKRYL